MGFERQATALLGSHKGKIWQFSSLGDTLTKTFAYGDTACLFHQLFELPGQEYLVFGNTFLPPNYSRLKEPLLLLRLDSTLNELEHRMILIEGYDNLCISHVERYESLYYISGVVSENSLAPFHPCHFTLTAGGEIQKCSIATEIVLDKPDYTPNDCLIDPRSGRMFTFCDAYDAINVYDSAFSFLGKKTFPESFNPNTADIDVFYAGWTTARWLTDSTFLVASLHHRTQNQMSIWDDYLGFSELDTTYSLVPVTHIGNSPGMGELDTVDYPAVRDSFDFRTTDSIFFTGTHNMISWFWPQEPSFIMAGMLNRELQPQYVRYYGGDAYYMARNMVCTSDGGFVIAATRYDYLTQNYENDVFFLKLNPEGQIVGTSKPDVCPESIFNLYPNPASEAFTLLLAPPKAEMQLFSLQGQTVHTQTLTRGENRITCQSLKPGTYLCKVITPQFTETKKIVIR